MATNKKRVAVLGAGVAGIFSLIGLQEEGTFEPTCFEKTDKPGGTWCYREEVTYGISSIMPTTIINHSKEMGAISKYPPPKEYSNFMRHSELYQYFMNIAKSEDILQHVQFKTEVLNVTQADNYDETGRWMVTVKNTITDEISTDVYDGVMVCTGQFSHPVMPTYKDQDLFKGEILHTHSLRGVERFKDKTVVVVGMGSSGLDAVAEISAVANQVYLSTRSGAHVMQRVGPHGYPFDYHLARRWIFFLFDILPRYMVSWLLEKVYMNPQFDPNLFAVKPKYPTLYKDPVINDYVPSKLLSGSVIQKPDIERFTESGVIFEGDTGVTRADTIIMATGYKCRYPFLENSVKLREDGCINLYKCVFPAQLKHGTLAVIAFILPFGPGFPVAELQTRWAVQVLAGKCKLPSTEAMLQEAQNRYKRNLKIYAPSEQTSVRIDYIQYCDDIASQIGAKPNLVKLFFTDLQLFCKLVFGPNVSYQYRLQGAHPWQGARHAIMTVDDRVLYPLTKESKNVFEENIILKILMKILRLVFY